MARVFLSPNNNSLASFWQNVKRHARSGKLQGLVLEAQGLGPGAWSGGQGAWGPGLGAWGLEAFRFWIADLKAKV